VVEQTRLALTAAPALPFIEARARLALVVGRAFHDPSTSKAVLIAARR
jgi:hypothetical protein